MFHEHSRQAVVLAVVVLWVSFAESTQRSAPVRYPPWPDVLPSYFGSPRFPQQIPSLYLTESALNHGISEAARTRLIGPGILRPQLPVNQKIKPVDVKSLPVSVLVSNSSLPVTVRNTSLGVQVQNVPLPVGIVNRTIFTQVTNLPLATAVVNKSLPVTLSNSSVPVKVLDLPLPVGVVNETIYTNVTNLPLPTVLINGSIPVTLSNSSVPVKVQDLPLPVGIVNETIYTNVTNLPLPTVLVNASIPVSVLNDQLKVTVQNTPFSVYLNDQPIDVRVDNTPLPVSFDQPVEVTSYQLSSQLANISNSNTALLNFLVSQSQKRYCPTDSNFGTETSAPCRRLNSTCYCFFNTITHTFSEATTFCKTSGFDGLVSLETKAEALLIADLLNLLFPPNAAVPKFFYTSGTDALVENNFVWNTTGAPFVASETYWRPPPQLEPNGNTTENCVVVRHPDGHWVDTSCNNLHNYICELGSVVNPIG